MIGSSPLVQGLHVTRTGMRKGVGVGQIGFDVENRGAVEQIDATHDQSQALHRYQLEYRQAQRIGPMGSPRCQDAALAGIARRSHLRFPTAAVVEPRNHPDVAEAREVGDRVLQSLPEHDRSGGDTARSRLARGFRVPAEGRVQNPDGTEGEGIERLLRIHAPNYESLRTEP